MANGLATENLELKARMARIELEIAELKKELQKLLPEIL
jgi:hypothetical protein